MINLLLFLLFLLWGAGMTPLSIALSRRYGILDIPNKRKIHHEPMPRGAGVVLWGGFMLWALLPVGSKSSLRIIATGATIVFFAGYIDDMFSLPPWGRLVTQFAAACFSLALIEPLESQGVLRSVLFIFWIAGAVNAWNFIDGMNGLSLSMSALSLLFLCAHDASGSALPLAAMVIGVLPWNFPRAKTFLGDGGVYLLGYIIAVLTMRWLAFQNISFFRLTLLLLLTGGVPVIDTLVVIVRRLSKGRSPFYPDRTHIHHRLLNIGLSPVVTLLVLCVLQTCSLLCAWYVSAF